jgi:iron complex outermembrane receptor protein
MVRKRYIGDTNEPLATRTTGISSSARTLIFADGIPLSTLLANNNNNTGSPRWNTVSPGEIERMDMLYGPFSAAYAGNSMGGVLNITTKMPTKFEAGASTQGSFSNYNIYNSTGTAYNQNYAANIGDKYKDFSFRFDYNHLLSDSQPISFMTNVIPGATQGTAGTRVSGAVASANPTNAQMYVMGAGSLNRTEQDNFKWKFAYDITPTIRAAYTLGLWQNSATSGVQSFLKDANGNTITSGTVNIGGHQYNLNGTASANNLAGSAATFAPSIQDQQTWSHGMSVKSDTGGKFDWELIGSLVELGTDTSRAATQNPVANAASANGQTGRTTVLTGSNWNTADAKGIWRPGDFYGNHEVSFGFHNDSYQLVNPVFNTINWQNGANTNANIYSDSEGKTRTQGYWVQDAWDFAKQWNFTAGGRLEDWNAFDGLNTSTIGSPTSTATTVTKTIYQKDLNSVNFSPKGKLTWTPRDALRFGVSVGQAYRYPTAGELFQTTSSTVGGVTTFLNGNPNLKPEDVLSSEVSSEYFLPKGKVRLSFFQERVRNAIYSTTSLYPNNTVQSFITNIGQTDTFGLELAGDANDVFIDKLNFHASGTWADSTITDNYAADAAAAMPGAFSASALAANPNSAAPSTGMMQPRIPTWRSTFTISYSPVKDLTTSVSGRYSSAMYSQLNNSDTNHSTYVGNSSYFVVDTKINYQVTKQWSINAGIDNINNQNYWIFHPFPQRTYVAQLKFNY